MANKPLVIDSRSGLPTGVVDKWTTLANMPIFIRDIVTPTLQAGSALGDMISGIPTPFARIDLFKAALDHYGTKAAAGDGLSLFYTTLVSEWRGLIAAIALDYTKFAVKRVNLAYHDGRNLTETENIYEPLGAFGNMLLERAPLWYSPGTTVPFIDIIKYDGKVVGGTSPDAFVFTSVGYKIENTKGRAWVDKEGKFIDPLTADLSEADLCALYAYVQYMLTNIGRVQTYYADLNSALAPNYSNVISNLQEWIQQIQAYAADHKYNLASSAVPPVDLSFDAPFSYLFNYKDELYGKDGILTSTAQGETLAFDPKKALLPKESEIARVILDPKYDKDPTLLDQLPVFVLKAPHKNSPEKYAYFALPLSALGLNVFGRNIGALAGIAGAGSNLKSSLTAIYDESAPENNLEVTLSLVTTDGKTRIFKESYTVRADKAIRKKDIVIWPNFISTQWNRYFLFSEMPHDAKSADYPYRAMPFVAEPKDAYTRILVDEGSEEPIYLAQDGKVVTPLDRDGKPLFKAELLVSADNRVADNIYKYEIYESNLPFKGVRLLSQTGKEGGFLVINYSSDHSEHLPHNEALSPVTLQDAVVGIDFGSTNTSVAYFDEFKNQVNGIKFKNRRVSLLASASDADINTPKEKQIFFFQGGEINSNAIKSILTLHDQRRLKVQGEGTDIRMLSREVKGGFPSFATSLPISEVSEEEIKLKFPKGIGDVTQIHNMKWSSRDIDKAHKEAFLRSLMLQIYAEMFQEKYVPTQLKWSYPSSMGLHMLLEYKLIWDSLRTISPIEGKTLQILAHHGRMVSDTGGGFDDEEEAEYNPFADTVNPFATNSMPADGASMESDPFGNNPIDIGDDPFASKNDPFGNTSSTDFDPFGSPKKSSKKVPDLMPDDKSQPIRFNPIKLPTNRSLTEACAVANYMSRQKNAGIGDKLTLCFDIGGSTTDFSALTRLNTPELGPTMIKQSSIRFAAKLVADATKYSPRFEEVIREIIARFNLTVMGINKGTAAYSSSTAPYFFEQIVDRLEPDQLPDFYNLIASKCPELMSVNLYVTGLITYYAGEIAAKLIKEVMKSPDCAWNGKPVVQVVFAGKGSRIFEWFSTTQPDMANRYYRDMFVLGMGGINEIGKLLSNWPQIHLATQPNDDVKFEVSKGLAASSGTLYIPKDEVIIEIIGEEGFKIKRPDGTKVEVGADNSITPEMMKYMGAYFLAPQPSFGGVSCNKFKEFAGQFFKYAVGCFGFKMNKEQFVEGFKNMNIDGYIINYPDFIQAQKRESARVGKFDFVAPVIILEGEKFYKDYLIPNLK